MVNRQLLTDLWHGNIADHTAAANVENAGIIRNLCVVQIRIVQLPQRLIVPVCGFEKTAVVLRLVLGQHGFVVDNRFTLGLGVPVAADGRV